MKRAQLVCQHLENISRKALEGRQHVIRQYVRGRHGVYALYRRNKLHYVGLATDLRNRLKHHLKDRHGNSWDRFSVYLTIGGHHLRELEALTLRIVQPAGNKQKGKFARSEDLCRNFKRDIKKCLLKEMDDIFFGKQLSQKSVPIKSMLLRGRRPAMAKFAFSSLKLRAVFKNQTFRALIKKNGMVRYAGKEYKSPSLAGRAVVGRACNGWHFWRYERAPGDWVKLDTLRK